MPALIPLGLALNVFFGARITPMDDADHYRHCTSLLNPSLGSRFDYDALETFDPQLAVQENCYHGLEPMTY